MTKMSTMPIHVKNTLRIFFRTISQMSLKLGTQQKGLEPYKVCINDDTRLTMTFFYNKVNFVHLGFNIWKSWKKLYKIKGQGDFLETYNKWIKW